MISPLELAPQDESGAETRADREEDERLGPLCDTVSALAERREIDVVLDPHAHAEALLQLGTIPPPVEPGDVRREPDHAAAFFDDAWDADHNLVDQSRLEAGRAGKGVAQLGDRGERAVGVGGAAELDVVARADRTGEIADGASQEARTEVDPEHERGLGHRLEVEGSVGGPRRPIGGLADEPCLEQRSEGERDRRLRDPGPPRDLRPRDRRSASDRLEHGLLVQALQQGRRGHSGIVVKKAYLYKWH